MKWMCSVVIGALAFAPWVARADVKPGDAAKDFALKGTAGDVRLSALRGKVVLVDFWANWCAPCKKELPALDVLQRKLAGKGVQILAVNIDKERANAERFLKSNGISSLTVLFDPEGEKVAKLYEPPTMPSSYVVDRNGVVRHVHKGFEPGDEAKIAAELEALAK